MNQAPGPATGRAATITFGVLGLAAFAAAYGQAPLYYSNQNQYFLHGLAEAGEGLLAEDNHIQYGVGELEGRLAAARSRVLDIATLIDERAAEGRSIGRDAGLDVIQAVQTLARAASDTVIFCFDHAPTSIVYSKHPLQRCLRDVFTGMKHASFTPTLLGRIGKVRLGMDYGARPF